MDGRSAGTRRRPPSCAREPVPRRAVMLGQTRDAHPVGDQRASSAFQSRPTWSFGLSYRTRSAGSGRRNQLGSHRPPHTSIGRIPRYGRDQRSSRCGTSVAECERPCRLFGRLGGGCHRRLEYRSARSGGSQQRHAEQWVRTRLVPAQGSLAITNALVASGVPGTGTVLVTQPSR
jgi:hypothetical protein